MLNKKLIEADEKVKNSGEKDGSTDAFGEMFVPLEKPMPTVKLAAGFEVSLRTMFRGQPCQSRYGRIENATYPISKEMRFKLQAALAWVSAEERKEITWISIDKDEALFAYPGSYGRINSVLLIFVNVLVMRKKRRRTRQQIKVKIRQALKQLQKSLWRRLKRQKPWGRILCRNGFVFYFAEIG